MRSEIALYEDRSLLPSRLRPVESFVYLSKPCLFSCRIDLAASARNLSSEGAESIRIEADHLLDARAERCQKAGRNHAFLSMLGKQRDTFAGQEVN